MTPYYYLMIIALILEGFLFLQILSNYRYALKKYKKERNWYRPRTALIIPCKGIDCDFKKNITSLIKQDYSNFLVYFIVEEKTDPAYEQLCELKQQLAPFSKALDIQILIAGSGTESTCSQKIHNLLYCYNRLSSDVEILAFADSDICARPEWLSHLVYPLRQSKVGATSGYRWYVPKRNNLATLALSAINAKFAQLFGNTVFNQAWGGSMAIKVDTFKALGVDKSWTTALSDDLCLSFLVKRAGKKIAYVPACLVATYEATTWPRLYEFCRRQFLITRISRPRSWWSTLITSIITIFGIWVGTLVAFYAVLAGNKNFPILFIMPAFFCFAQLTFAVLRQKMIAQLLEDELPGMKRAMIADILLFWLWSPLLFFFIVSSAFGRTITWRGIKYKLLSPTKTIIIID